MFADLRIAVGAALVAVIAVGVVLASIFIQATSSGPPPATSATAIATRSLPPFWVIRPGDTFTSIAAHNHLTPSQLQDLNPAQDPVNLVPGQHLRLHPQAPAAPVHHNLGPHFWVVAPGDTFSSIAVKSGVPVGDIASFNPKVDPALLKPGQRLRLRP